MSESSERAERRQLRRIAGAELIDFAKDTTQAIQVQQAGLVTLEARIEAAQGQITALQLACLVLTRGFWGRCLWLVTGR